MKSKAMRKLQRKRQLAGLLVTANLLSLCTPASVYADAAKAAENGQEAPSAAAKEASAPVNSIDSLVNLYQAANDKKNGTEPDTAQEGDLAFVNVDETLYVNLDYYGKVTKTNVVKGISSSKKMDYTDYGDYAEVINMSNQNKLKTAPGKVSFALDGTGKKFFIEGRMQPDTVELPWNLTVSYKLNGVPVEAEKLKGASGVIEIDIHAEPNDKADDYMRNNMILAAAVPVDESKIYSVDAPGAQTQSIGEMTGVVFTALPGERRDFVARLGTDSYESIGVIFMMIPGTTDSLDNIADIKNLRDTWRNSGNAMYDSMDDLLGIVESLRGEMNGISGSLRLADSVRGQLYASKDSIFNTNDKALADLNQLGTEMQKLIPYLSAVQPKIWQLNSDVNDLVGMLSGMQSSLSYLARGLNKLADGSFDTKDDIGDLVTRLTGITGNLTDQSGDYQKQLTKIIQLIDEMLAQLPADGELTAEELQGYWQEALDKLDPFGKGGSDATPSNAANAATPSYASIDALSGMDSEELTQALSSLAASYGIEGAVPESDYEVLADSAVSVKAINHVLKDLRTKLIDLKEKLRNMQQLPQDANSLTDSMQDLLAGAGRTGTGAHYTVEDLQDTIAKVEQLNNTVNSMYPDLQSSLSQMQVLLAQAGTSLNSASNALSLTQNTLRSVSDTADASMREGIASSLSLINKTLDMLDATKGIRSAGQEAKDTLDRELDKYDTENNFLNIDPNAKKLSFTSAENKTPNSVQIILRTDEISKDEDNDEVMDAEKPAKDEGILTRIKNIFVKIIKAIVEAFQEA